MAEPVADCKGVDCPVVDYTAAVELVAAPCLRGLCTAGQRRHILATYRWKHYKTCIYACNNQHEDYVSAEGRLVAEVAAAVVDTLAAAAAVVDTLAVAAAVVDTLAAAAAVVDTLAVAAAVADTQAVAAAVADTQAVAAAVADTQAVVAVAADTPAVK